MTKFSSLKSRITIFFLLLISVYFVINIILSIIYINNEKREDLEILMTHALSESLDYVKKDQEKTNLTFLYSIPHMTSVLRKSGAREIEFFFSKSVYKPKSNEIAVFKVLNNGIYFNLKSTDVEIKKHIYETIFNSIFWHLIFLIVVGILGVYFIHKMLLPLSHIAEQCKNYKDDNEFYLNDKYAASEIYQLESALNMLVRRFRNLRKKDKEIFTQATHELKTPLSIIKARLDNYKDNKDYSKSSFIKAIDEDIQRLYLEIQSMLYFNIFDFDDKENFSVLNEVKECIKKVEILLKDRSLNIEIKGNDFRLIARKKLFIKMFMSIFENAVTYAKKDSTINIFIGENKLHIKNVKSTEINLFSSKLGIKILDKLSCELNFTFNIIKDNNTYEVILNFMEYIE
ncbi:HAMP domain-containing sensor histidine kinase [Helicobacter sp. MIT 14-3879]|uniref:sensor histidine kinase n=1 Tax=Helicobacter sp. MIT 14-3879 TaxID=2040649 RepID=UPI000E1EF742|nr:HAMP domain-containing sensor histidine kinase [Helicobacter sp. MIT 14-3879]RDU65553.1 hypothetical protein CQA44_00820 [Helicobacter sp. MIT 14-3879]